MISCHQEPCITCYQADRGVPQGNSLINGLLNSSPGSPSLPLFIPQDRAYLGCLLKEVTRGAP